MDLIRGKFRYHKSEDNKIYRIQTIRNKFEDIRITVCKMILNNANMYRALKLLDEAEKYCLESLNMEKLD